MAHTAAMWRLYALARGFGGANGRRLFAAAAGGGAALSGVAAGAEPPPPRLDLIAVARECYRPGYAFPSWIREGDAGVDLSELDWAGAELYYPSSAAEGEVRRVATEREPVNIAMRRLYDEEAMRRIFGWARSRYSSHWDENGTLAPVIAAYCRTPVATAASDGRAGADGDPALTPPRDAHVLNVIAPALDSVLQPDFQHFFPDGRGSAIGAARLEELRARYEYAFRVAFACARRKGLRRVLLPLFGCGAFSAEFRCPHGGVFDAVYLPALAKAMPGATGIDVVGCFGVPGDRPQLDRVAAVVNAAGKRTGIFGAFPSQTPTDRETLVVNAWDPHSLCGNGNAADASLDGYVGRHTAVSVLCWPAINTQLRYVPCGDVQRGPSSSL